MSRASFGKPLKGAGTLSARFLSPIEDSIFAALSSGGIPLENVEITGGTIDGVVIGTNQPGPGTFTTIDSGSPSGQGYEVCFFGQTVGDSACWEPVTGTWIIQGDLLVRDISDFGNLRISGNTLSSTNTNGNIILDPNGTGIVSVVGPITQSTSLGNILFNTDNGLYNLSASSTITSTSGTNTLLRTTNGDVTLQTGLSIPTTNITAISTGSTVTVTTSGIHGLLAGNKITISNTNSSPVINGIHTVLSVPSTNTFTTTPLLPVTSSGNTGTVKKHNDINLLATDNVNIPANVGLAFADKKINIVSNGTDLTVNNQLGDIVLNKKTIINGDLTVNGNTTTVKSTVVTIDDPVFTLGGETVPLVDDNKDRGIEFRWHDGVSGKTGFFGIDDSTGCFTFIPDAVNNSEVFSGAPGCVHFGEIEGTSLNLQGGSINSGSIDVSNITSTNTMTLTAPTIILNSEDVEIIDPVITLGQGTTDDNKSRGVEFNWNDGTETRLGFFGMDDTDNCFKYIPIATNTDEVLTGTPGCAEFGDMTVQDLTINGSINAVNGLLSVEYLSAAGGSSVSPSSVKNISFIQVTTPGIVTGVLPSNTVDGYIKHIMIYSLASGAEYHLSAPSGRLLDPGSGTTAAKTLKFKYSGQSVYVLWSNVANTYIIVNAGACIE